MCRYLCRWLYLCPVSDVLLHGFDRCLGDGVGVGVGVGDPVTRCMTSRRAVTSRSSAGNGPAHLLTRLSARLVTGDRRWCVREVPITYVQDRGTSLSAQTYGTG